jgi:hypothetical protein
MLDKELVIRALKAALAVLETVEVQPTAVELATAEPQAAEPLAVEVELVEVQPEPLAAEPLTPEVQPEPLAAEPEPELVEVQPKGKAKKVHLKPLAGLPLNTALPENLRAIDNIINIDKLEVPPSPTYEEVKARALEVAQKMGRDVLIQILAALGAQKLVEIRPEKFRDFMDLSAAVCL